MKFDAELQKRANFANLLVLIFPAGANVLSNNAKNCVHFTYGTGSHHCKLYNLQCVSSTGATNTLLVTPVLEAPLLVALVLAPVLLPMFY